VAYVSVAILHERQNEDPSEPYAHAYELDPLNAAAALGYGRCLLEGGRADLAVGILEPVANYPSAPLQSREAFGRALLACGQLKRAEPLIWEMFQQDPKNHGEPVKQLIGSYLDEGNGSEACALASGLEEFHRRAGTRREFVAQMKEVADHHRSNVAFLEYLVELFNSSNREHDYCSTLLKLFDIYVAAGKFLKAAENLDRAAEVDPYEPGHQKRMQLLRGKIDNGRFNAIANRFQGVVQSETQQAQATADDSESTVLEDLILQAEIFLQYSMRSKAVERLERIAKLFPHEEDTNEKLRQLWLSAGFNAHYEESATRLSAAASTSTPQAATTVSRALANETAVDNISRVTEITRNIYRQSNVKSVLFTAVNDIGRHWSASRCVAGLISPGKPPSAAMEYCAPGIKQSDVMSIVKIIGLMQKLCVAHGGAIAIPNALAAPELAEIEPILASLNVHSVMAVSLMDGDEHAGVLILEQCGIQRQWLSTDQVVLRTIADQMVLAVNNARLRSLVKNLAVTDEKSGLLKRSSYLDVLMSEVTRSTEQGSPLSVMLMDFGKASAMVRELGESGVESLMQEVGQTICSHIRQNDVAVRYDLTQIALILADTNDKNAFFVVEKMRKLLQNAQFMGKSVPIKSTVGIAEAVLHAPYDPVDVVTEVINRAEASLQAARAEGGNMARALSPAFAPTAVAS
jgi:diguanylate cyclase (GGDEF)-like protein